MSALFFTTPFSSSATSQSGASGSVPALPSEMRISKVTFLFSSVIHLLPSVDSLRSESIKSQRCTTLIWPIPHNTLCQSIINTHFGMAKSKAQALPLVTIVGRPNVGKSTLFNRLIGERRAIVGDEPGITRDRIYGGVDWSGLRFSLIDTGGIVPDDDAVIPANIFKQAGRAIDDSQVLIWVVDARKGITQLDEELAQ